MRNELIMLMSRSFVALAISLSVEIRLKAAKKFPLPQRV